MGIFAFSEHFHVYSHCGDLGDRESLYPSALVTYILDRVGSSRGQPWGHSQPLVIWGQAWDR